MKFNFKKITSVLASVIMLGSTIGFAAAAWPAPFVNGGADNATVVYGASSTDYAAATNIGAELSKSVTGVATTTSTTLLGESVKLQRGTTDMFNLGDETNDFYATIDSEEFATVLADGVYLSDDNTEYDTEQEIEIGALELTHFQDSSFNDEKPVIGFNLNSGDTILNYTLNFPTAVAGGTAWAELHNTNLEMLGKTFFISDAETTSNGLKITLLDSANMVTLSEDDAPKTVSVGDKTYEVSISFITTDEVKLLVNGQTTNTLGVGETYKLKDGTYVGIKEIDVQNYAGGKKNVEFSLGVGKLVLENGQEVELNEEAISDLEDANGYTSVINSYITNTTTDLSKIVLEWKLNDDAWIAPGTELTMPGFNAIKLSMEKFTAPKSEVTMLDDNGDSVQLNTEITDGNLEISLLYANASGTGFGGLGETDSVVLVTNASADPTYVLNETDDAYFVTTWISGDDSESYAYEVKSVGTDNKTVLTNLAGGKDLEFAEVGSDADRGQVTFTLVNVNADHTVATIQATKSSGTLYGDRLVSKEGLQMKMPVLNSQVNYTAHPLTDGELASNATAVGYPGTATWVMNFTEESDTGTIAGGNSFTVTLGVTTDGTEPTAMAGAGTTTGLETEKDSDQYVEYVISSLATKLLWDKPTGSSLNTMEITYAGDESYADVYLAETGLTTSTTPTYAGTVKVVKDSELDAAGKEKNLVVIGGSCINTVASDLLGGALCGADFTTKTDVAAGSYLVKVYANPYAAASGKIAMLIAGYDAADTLNAVTKVKEDASFQLTTVDASKIGPVTA